MSGAEKLTEKILGEAQSFAEQVMSGARQQAEAILTKARQEAENRRNQLLTEARQQAEEKKRRARTIAELEARKALLAAKKELIEDTFTRALERLQHMEPAEYEKVITSMLLAAAETGTEEIIVAAADRDRFTDSFLQRVNNELVKQGKQGKLTLAAETRDIQGGFILRTSDAEINSSFPALLRMQREQLEPDVAAILFA
ncbi:MAG TPA: hypothetical protein GX699_11300 [Firmicutes bacterium]|nr:hypothetical protein [Bacillota bacterium]